MALLKFDNIPNGMISGASTEELEWVAFQSGEREVFELSDEFMRMLDNAESSTNLTEESTETIFNEIELLDSDLTWFNDVSNRFGRFY